MNFGEDEDEDDEDLDLDMDNNDLDDIVDSDDEEENTKGGKKKGKRSIAASDVTEELLQSLMKQTMADNGSFTALKKILGIFRVACIPNAAEDDEDQVRFVISSPELYEHVMTTIIEFAHKAIYFFLKVENPAEITKESMEKNPRWKTVNLLLLHVLLRIF